MASRKAAFDEADDDRPTKRPRFDKVEPPISPPSLENINIDCLLRILSFLQAEDLNSVAICSRRYCKARAHESLDQTRTGTIFIASRRMTPDSFMDACIAKEWSNAFQGNRTSLVINGMDRLRISDMVSRNIFSDTFNVTPRVQLDGVTHLRLVGRYNGPPVPAYDLLRFNSIFPNLREINLTQLTVGRPTSSAFLAFTFSGCCPSLSRFVWNNTDGESQSLDGSYFQKAKNLSSISLDGCRFLEEDDEYEWDSDLRAQDRRQDRFMFYHCRSLVRLSIKNATYQNRPIPQEMLIKMVRHHPTLRWLRSDLTEENMAILRNERPEVTLVNE